MSKKIRNQDAYNAACEKHFARREQRINQIISSIEYTVRRGTDFYGKDFQDVAWQLRVSGGVLGKYDRRKDRSDDYGKDIIEALERARQDADCPIVIHNGVSGIIVSHNDRAEFQQVKLTKLMGRNSPTLPKKFVRPYADLEYTEALFVYGYDEVDSLCDPSHPRFKTVKGTLPKELIDH